MEHHQKTFELLRRILFQVERSPEATLHASASRHPKPDTLRHDISIAVSALWLFINDVDKCISAAGIAGERDYAIFTLMNERLLNQRKFREVITRIMSSYYECMNSKAVFHEDTRIVLLGRLVEALALYIKRARHETNLSEEEAFANTIALMKVNRILQLQDLKVSETDVYHDFSVEQASDESAPTIANCVATNKSSENQQIAAENLKKLRRLRADMNRWSTALQIFDRCFTNLLYSKLTFALLWKEALGCKDFGYAYEIYAEKCNKELEECKGKSDDISRVIEKLKEAEMSLLVLEVKAATGSLTFLKTMHSLSESVKRTLPLFVAMCLSAIGAKYKALIGDANLDKYREMRSMVEVENSHSTDKYASVPRNRSVFKMEQSVSSEKNTSRMLKVADIFRSPESKKLATKNRQRSYHHDIIEEYESAFSQTVAMLEEASPAETGEQS